MRWIKFFSFALVGMTSIFLLSSQNGAKAVTQVSNQEDRVPAQLSFNQSEYYIPKDTDKAISEFPSTHKWHIYKSFDELQRDKKINVYAPHFLPDGYQVDKIEYANEIAIATYTDGVGIIAFAQSAKEQPVFRDDSSLILRWTDFPFYFEVKGDKDTQSNDLKVFKQSLFLMPSLDNNEKKSFSILNLTGPLQKFKPQEQNFRLFNNKQFSDFIEEENLKLNSQQHTISNSELIIGLFAGEKGSSGYTIAATQLIKREKNIIIIFDESSPAPDMATLAVITHPYQFISLQIPGEEVTNIQFITTRGEAIASLRVEDMS